jgi:hypothetical protein
LPENQPFERAIRVSKKGILLSKIAYACVGERLKERKITMLIFNDEQRLRAGVPSLSKRCPYCRKALRAYPLILSDDATFAVYHAACAAALAIEIQVDLYTFFRPPAPYQQLFVLNGTQRTCLQEELCSQQT